MVKRKLAMLTVAVAVICGLVAVGPAVQPAALADGEEPLLLAIGEITAELQEVNSTLKGLVPEKVKKPKVEWVGQYSAAGLQFELAQTMCDDIFAASEGLLVLDLKSGGELCPTDEEFSEVDQGNMDFAVSSRLFPWDRFPAAPLFDSRCGGMSPMEYYLWIISGGGAELAQEMIDDSDVYIIPGGGQLWTPEIFLQSKVPITETNDLVGLDIRTAGDCWEILHRMGADTVFMPGSEIYKALEDGVIDACEFSSPCLNWSFKFHEVAEYVYLSECRYPHGHILFLVNKDVWSELPDDVKVVVEKLAREQAIKSYGEGCQCDLEALENFEDYGCTVQRLSQAVEEAFLAEAEAFYEEKADYLDGEGYPLYREILESQLAFQEDFREVWARP